MIRFFILPILLINTLQIAAQDANKFIRPEVSSIAENLVLDPSLVRDNMLKGLPQDYLEGDYSRDLKVYTENVAYGVCNRLSNGKVYSNWPEMEEYMAKIVEQVIPDEIKEDQVLHTYLYKSGDFNASMHASGVMMMNIGTWTYMESEAELAAIIAHELAHYYKHHSVKNFLNEVKGEYDLGLGGDSYKLRWKASQAFELEADSLAYVWLSESPYSMEGASELLYLLQRLENHQIKRSKKRWDSKATSHPLSDERLEQLQRAKAKYAGQGARFIQDEGLFNELKKQAKLEALEVKLRDFDYRTAVEMAFKFHILAPDNKDYVYYLMESIRRLCYRDNDYWNKNFITDGYYQEQVTESQDNKVPIEDHIFASFDPAVMSMAPSELRAIQARFYWQEDLKFRTNEEAFMFFYLLGDALGCEECHFSEALSQISDSAARNKALEKYLSTPTPMYADAAKMLRDSTMREGIEEQKVTVFNQFSAFVNQGQDPIPVNIQSGPTDHLLAEFLEDAMKDMDGRSYIYLQSLQDGELEKYMMLQEMKALSRQTFHSKGAKPELYIIDPRYIDLFKEYKAEEIEFVECRFTEFRKKENSEEALEKATQMTYDDILNGLNSTRFFELYVSSIRSVEEGRMKYQYYSGEVKLKNKDASGPQIRSAIRRELISKEDRMKKDHMYYRRL